MWLKQFLGWVCRINLIVVVALTVAAALTPTSYWWSIVALLGGCLAVQGMAYRLVASGQLTRGGLLSSLAVIVVSLSNALIEPTSWIISLLLLSLALVISLPYLSARALRLLLGLTSLCIPLILVKAYRDGLFPHNSWLATIALLFGMLTVMLFTHWRLSQYHAQMNALIGQSAVAQRSLEEVNASLAREVLSGVDRAAHLLALSQLTSDYIYSMKVLPDGEIENEWMTDAFQRITGYSPDELGSRGLWLTIIHPEDREQTIVMLDKHRAGRSTVFEFRVVRPDGEIRWVREVTKPELDADSGRVVRVLGAAQDITEQRRAEHERQDIERKMLEAQKLESLGVLAGGIAHDFNNLLTVIQGNLSLITSLIEPDSSLHTRLSRIDLATQRAADLTRQMLAYAGKGRFVVQIVDINVVLREMTPLLESSIGKHADLTLAAGLGLPPLEVDVTQINQVVMNLVINASEAMAERGGRVEIATSAALLSELPPGAVISPQAFQPGPYVCLTVRDAGAGMSEETIGRIFDPFFTTKFAGRGLGLAAVQGIVRAHLGVLAVQSAPGSGTTFRIFLPVAIDEMLEQEERGQPPLARIGAPSPAAPLRIGAPSPAASLRTVMLVIDDEEAVRLTVAQILAQLGFEVLLATNGRDGVAAFCNNHSRIGCVFLDLTMPQLSGEKALELIRAFDPSVPVVLMSGYSNDDVTARIALANPPLFIQKPFGIQEIRTIVEQLQLA